MFVAESSLLLQSLQSQHHLTEVIFPFHLFLDCILSTYTSAALFRAQNT